MDLRSQASAALISPRSPVGARQDRLRVGARLLYISSLARIHQRRVNMLSGIMGKGMPSPLFQNTKQIRIGQSYVVT